MTGEPSTIVLMGLRGSGKSTVAALLAGLLGTEHADLDDATCARLGGGRLADLWATHGERTFRAAESAALAALLGAPPGVIALGGGTPTAPGAADLLLDAVESRGAAIVYLRASPATLRGRLEATDTAGRPSLTGAGTLDEIEEVFRARDPLYRRLASLELATDGMSAPEVADLLARRFSAPRPPLGPRGRTP